MRMVAHLLGHRSAQNNSIKRWTNGGPDAALEGGLDGGLTVGFE